MRFDPRAVTGIPTEPVGSLPRPQALLDAYAQHDAGRLDDVGLDAALDSAVRDTVADGEATGAPVISDGEQRRSSFAAYPVTGTSAGAGRSPSLDAEGRYYSLFGSAVDGHGRWLSGPTDDGPFRYKSYAGDTLARSAGYATRPMKQAVVSPSMLALLYPHGDELPGYSRTQFESDLVEECERDIRSAFDAGAARVSIDLADGRLANRGDPRTSTGTGALGYYTDLVNAVLDRFPARQRMHIGVHACMGADRGPAHTADVGYADLLPEVLRIDAGYFLLQLAAEPDQDAVLATIAKHLRSDANGVTPMAYVGVTDPRSSRVESAQEVADTLVRAASYIPAEQLGSTDDCGFSPFSRDVTPLRGLPDMSRGIAFRKIRSRVEGTYLAAEKVGIA